MSAAKREPALTISPFRINKPIFALGAIRSVDVDAHFVAILLHFLPIFGDFALRVGDFFPGDRRTFGWLFHHVDAIFHGADVIAETAADTIPFADLNLGARADGFFLAVRTDVVRLWGDDGAIFGDQINAWVGSVVARDIAKIAANAFVLVDASDGAEGKVKMVEVRNAMEAFRDDVGEFRKAFFVHPVGKAVA